MDEQHKMMDVITYPGRDLSQSQEVKWVPRLLCYRGAYSGWAWEGYIEREQRLGYILIYFVWFYRYWSSVPFIFSSQYRNPIQPHSLYTLPGPSFINTV